MPATDIDFGASAREGWRIGEMFANVFWNVALFLIRPLGLLTQVFFRKEMGERYMSPLPVAVASLLLLVAYVMTIKIPAPVPMLWLYLKITGEKTVNMWYFPKAEIWLLVAWMLLFSVAVWENKFRAWRRYNKGVRWHSRSMGVPRISWMGGLLEYTFLIVAAGVIDMMALSWVALLIIASGVATAITNYAVARQLYNSVLDALDSELESETLNHAIRERLSPKQTHGMAVWLPRSLSRFLANRENGASSGSHSRSPSVHAVVEPKPERVMPITN